MQITSLDSKIVIDNDIQSSLKKAIEALKPTSIFILVDENTKKHCFIQTEYYGLQNNLKIIEIKSGEENKKIETCAQIWEFLSTHGADRKSVLINLGGGVICDMGGFAAATFKRGIYFINIPTTLLSQVDASIGGKLAINSGGLKNEIGIFKTPDYVLVDPIFLQTIDDDNFLSGFAEMVKHALIYSEEQWNKIKEYSPSQTPRDYVKLQTLISKSLLIKNDFVQKDPTEQGIRKALNFGHTVGHAIESWAMYNKTPLLHGQAVAQGMIFAAYLSVKKVRFSEQKMTEIIDYIQDHYQKIEITTTDYEKLYELMLHDKKNEHGKINFTLLKSIGQVEINIPCSKEEVFEALDFYRQLS